VAVESEKQTRKKMERIFANKKASAERFCGCCKKRTQGQTSSYLIAYFGTLFKHVAWVF
jgi:hypothetical protein